MTLLRLDFAPLAHLGGCLLDGEEVLALNPAVLDGLLPRVTALAHTDDDVEAIVTQVETLAVTLGAVAEESEGVVLEVVVELCGREDEESAMEL